MVYRYIEFYITNICNLTCTECRSFNNFDFKGHYEFSNDLYQPWADKIQFDSYVLLGGEPLLHPNFKSWVEGTRQLWPNAWAKIDTNGTQITKVKNLHQLLRDNEYFICINIHNPSKIKTVMQDVITAFGQCEVTNWADPRITYNDKFADKFGHDVLTGTWLISELGLPIQLRPAWSFEKTISSSTQWQNLKDKKSIYLGDATLAHRACGSKTCHVMLDGKVYKCSTVATLPEFLKQQKLEWPNELLYQYQPLTPETYSDLNYNELNKEIPQCAFCPVGASDYIDISTSDIKQKKNKIIPIVSNL